MISFSNDDAACPLPLMAAPVAGSAGDPEALRAWASRNLPELWARIRRHGAVLFRGFNFQTVVAFEEFTRVFSPELVGYAGGVSPRKQVAGKVFTSTEFSRRQLISQHNEGSYLPVMPRMIYFYCAQPGSSGGRTPLADSRKVLAGQETAIREAFDQRGVLYVNTLHGGIGFGRSWQDQFGTPERTEVEALLHKGGYAYSWRSDGGLRTQLRCPAIARHPATGDEVWIGQPDHWHPSGLEPRERARMARILPEDDFPCNCFYGDGGRIDENDLAHLRTVIKSETVSFPWQAGDVLVCDNYLVSHGREPFEGDRRVYVTLG